MSTNEYQTPTVATHRLLSGHVSHETAFVQADYPWGATLRCERRVWIEEATKGAGKGKFRSVFQTKDPRTGRWCAPKCSTYSDRIYLFERKDQPGYLDTVHLDLNYLDKAQAFHDAWIHAMDETQRTSLLAFLDFARKWDKIMDLTTKGELTCP